jgi:hypothetical protein
MRQLCHVLIHRYTTRKHSGEGTSGQEPGRGTRMRRVCGRRCTPVQYVCYEQAVRVIPALALAVTIKGCRHTPHMCACALAAA